MLDKIILNSNRFWDSIKASCGLIFGIISAVLLFVDKEKLGINTLKTGIIVLGGSLLLALICSVISVTFYTKVETIKGKVVLKYDDLWNISFCKRGKNKIVVVGVNTTFDTIVDEELSIVDKPLVSPTTIHGQWLKQMKKRGVAIPDIDDAIEQSLELQNITPRVEISPEVKTRGKCKCYPKGTIAVYEYGKTIFYLLALSEFDENNNAQNSKEELIQTIIQLINYYNMKGNGFDLYLPLLGAGQSRTGISQQDSLELITALFKAYQEKIHGCVNVIVYSKDRDKVSLDI